jgi:NAD(P)-dependent dehydrogenase (short-subunit alcohol dehydrogenase family)
VELARRGHSVGLVGRDPAKLSGVADRVAAVADRRPDILTCDYASFDQVRELAAALLDRYERIDVLANNAGIMTTRRQLTGDGHELIIQVNHLSPFLLTYLLLDRLSASGARIVTTSSQAARTGRVDPDDLDRSHRRWSGWLQYGDSKQANALTTAELARLGRGLVPTCFNPGVIRTGFAAGTMFMKLVTSIPGVSRSAEQGASTLVRLAADPGATAHPGRYFAKGAPVRVPRTMSDPGLAGRLWSASLALVTK